MLVFDQLKRNDVQLQVITAIVLSGILVLLTGLWWVQVFSFQRYSENQKAQAFRTVRIPAIRGKIPPSPLVITRWPGASLQFRER